MLDTKVRLYNKKSKMQNKNEKTITGLYSSLELPKIIKNILNILINVEINAAT